MKLKKQLIVAILLVSLSCLVFWKLRNSYKKEHSSTSRPSEIESLLTKIESVPIHSSRNSFLASIDIKKDADVQNLSSPNRFAPFLFEKWKLDNDYTLVVHYGIELPADRLFFLSAIITDAEGEMIISVGKRRGTPKR